MLNDSTERKKSLLKAIGFSVLGYFFIYILYTWPLALNFLSHIPGKEDSDVYAYLWDTFRTSQTLSHIFFIETDLFFAPLGVQQTFLHTAVPLISLFTMPFENTALGINLFLVLSYVISGIGGFLLCRQFVSNPWLCFLAGFIFSFSPWKMARLEVHYNMIQTAFVPFYILFLVRAFRFDQISLFRVNSRSTFLIWILTGFLLLLSDKVTTIIMAFFTLLYVLWYKLPFVQNFRFSVKSLVLLGILITAGHYGMVFLKSYFHDNGAFWWGADILGLVIPWHHLLIADLFPESWISEVHNRGLENVIYVGFSFLLASFTLFWLGRKFKMPPALKAFCFSGIILLSLTVPEVSIANETLFNNPLSFFHFIPGINAFRCPGRFIMPVYLLIIIPAFYFFEKLSYKKVYAVILLLLFLVEFAPAGIQTINIQETPKVYRTLKTLEGENLLPIPFGIKNGYIGAGDFRKKDMWHQTVHQKNLIAGYGPFGDQVWDYYHKDTVMNTLLKVQRDTTIDIPNFSEKQKRQFFKRFQPDFLVIDQNYPNTKARKITKEIIKHRITQKREIGQHTLFLLRSE